MNNPEAFDAQARSTASGQFVVLAGEAYEFGGYTGSTKPSKPLLALLDWAAPVLL